MYDILQALPDLTDMPQRSEWNDMFEVAQVRLLSYTDTPH